MDEKDVQILDVLSRLGTGSLDRIADEADIPKSTVHYRLEQLAEDGVIKNDLLDIDLKKSGLGVTVISEVWAEYGEGFHEVVGEKLSKIEGVNQVYFTMGGTDFIVIAHLINHDMIERLVEDYESIDEINRTSTRSAITTIKREPRPFNDFEMVTLSEELAQN